MYIVLFPQEDIHEFLKLLPQLNVEFYCSFTDNSLRTSSSAMFTGYLFSYVAFCSANRVALVSTLRPVDTRRFRVFLQNNLLRLNSKGNAKRKTQ